jgi:putative transposase
VLSSPTTSATRRGSRSPPRSPITANGTTPKTVVTEDGALPLAIPRKRAGSFTPQLVPKGARRLPRFDQNVLSLYTRGMSVREIREHLEELYQVEVAPDLISTVTDEVLEEITAWQQRPLESCYPVVFFDALRVKIRDEGVVRTKAVYLALGITRSGTKDVLGLWIEQTEGTKFWHRVMTELQAKPNGTPTPRILLIDRVRGESWTEVRTLAGPRVCTYPGAKAVALPLTAARIPRRRTHSR